MKTLNERYNVTARQTRQTKRTAKRDYMTALRNSGTLLVVALGGLVLLFAQTVLG